MKHDNVNDLIRHLNEVHDVACWIQTQLIRWGRVPVSDAKEKWGEVRVYCTFGWWNLHDFVYPGHHWSRFPKWLNNLDEAFFAGVFNLLQPATERYHRWLYRRVYKRALAKWPHLRKPILQGADWHEYLAGL